MSLLAEFRQTAAPQAGMALGALLAVGAITLCPGQSASPLKVGFGNSPPMTYKDARGKPAGFAVDVVVEAARREGMQLQWVPAGGRSTEAALQAGEFDMLATGIPTPERRRLFYVSEPWWDLELVALSLISGPVEREEDLRGKRIAAAGSGRGTAADYQPSQTLPVASAAAAASEVCAGRADAAIIGSVYERELLAAKPPACRGVGLRVIDLSGTVALALIARPGARGEAERLRGSIDRLIMDGTLVRIAAKHHPASRANAERAAKLAREDFDQRIWRLVEGAFAVLFFILLAFLLRLHRSRRKLRETNALLVKAGEVREEALLALKRSEERFRRLVDAGYDWIWEIDAEARYTFAGPQVRRLLGYEPEEILGRTPFDLMRPDEVERVRALLNEHVAARSPITNLENINLHKNGSEVVLETSGVPKFGAAGEFLGYSGADRDITARKREESSRSMQAEVSRVLASGNGHEEIMRGVLAVLAAAGRSRAGLSWRLDPLSGALTNDGFWQAPGMDGAALALAAKQVRPTLSDCLAPQACGSDQPQIFSVRGHSCEQCMVGPAGAEGCEWGLTIPLRSANRTTGLLILLGRERPPADAEGLETLRVIGAQLGEFLERERAQEEVRRFVTSSPGVLYALRVVPGGFQPSFASGNLERLTGYTPAEALTENWWRDQLHPADRDRVLEMNEALLKLRHQTLEYRFLHKNGRYIWLSDEKRLICDEYGAPQEVVGVWSDVTRRAELERQLLQARKLEAIGSLAAGVAHDFNNLLTVINGYTELIQHNVSPDDAAHEHLEQVLRAGESAAGLTRRLLAFSRRQELQPRLLTLPALVADTRKMLRRMVGEDIEFVVNTRGGASILADPSQMEQVLMNLVVNSRDAMPDGGTLTISTDEVRLREVENGVPAGDYAVLTVQDTGTGIDEAIQTQIFDPFFTTKEAGKGTGLGLSTVYGIVTQSGGYVTIESRLGVGSTFRTWFPVCGERPGASAGGAAPDGRGEETILLVEDEDLVREVAGEALRSRGYRVIPASCAADALAAAVQGKIDLLLTDLVMPGINGVELAKRFRALHPGTRILFMTGYADPKLRGQEIPPDMPCLQKPFKAAELTLKVRQVLEGEDR